MNKFLAEKYKFTSFGHELFMVKMKNVNNTKITYIWGQITSDYCSQIIIVHVHVNGFL